MADSGLLIDIDGQDVHFATSRKDGSSDLGDRRSYHSRDFITATDCILRYAQDTGIQLRGLMTVVIISGPVVGDTVRIARCPWIISIRGIGYLIDREPFVINDSAAKLWSDLEPTRNSHTPIGGPAGSTQHGRGMGRFLAVNFATGLGAALFVRNTDGTFHVETELGQIGFAPNGDDEKALLQALSKPPAPVCWERALLTGPSDPVWAKAGIGADSRRIATIRAGMLGSFCGDAVLATGAWGGVTLHGNGRDVLSNDALLAIFNERFEGRAAYNSNLRQIPRWRVERPDVNLVGAIKYLHAKRVAGTPQANPTR